MRYHCVRPTDYWASISAAMGSFIRGPCTRRNTFRDLDWVSLAKGMGVEARRVDTVDELVLAFRAGVAVKGPFLIEVVL
jgi:thiamine pyrophosphate-dependent acetolactate synthase large subunit-like protein